MPSQTLRAKLLVLAALAAVALTALSALADGLTQPLFFIQRSKNANEVHYDARLTKDGALDPNDPVEGYWLNKAEDGSRSGISLRCSASRTATTSSRPATGRTS